MDDVVHSTLPRSRKRSAAGTKVVPLEVKPKLVDARPRPTRAEAEAAVAVLLSWAGDDPAREGLRDTPARVAKAYEELFAGYAQDPSDVLDTVFEDVQGYGEMVLVRDIPFVSHCEHHMAPFFGKAHVAYYPDGGVLGLSKLGRLVDLYARRLQTAGSPDGADRGGARFPPAFARRRGAGGGGAHVHVDARRAQTGRPDHDDAVQRPVQDRPGRAGAVPEPGQGTVTVDGGVPT